METARDSLEDVKERLARKFRGEWMDAIYPGLGFKEQKRAFGRDLLSLGHAVLEAEEDASQTERDARLSADVDVHQAVLHYAAVQAAGGSQYVRQAGQTTSPWARLIEAVEARQRAYGCT